MPRLSAILITKNEEAHIGACLQSLAFVDEIIILDGASSDRTVEIALEHGARVVVDPAWPGFGPQKNRVLDMAEGEWVLSIDADERITPELAEEIRSVLNDDGAVACAIPRASYFCGQRIHYCGWWPDPVIRLFRRQSCRFSQDLVHERLLVPDAVPVLRLQHPMLHYSYSNLEQVLRKIDSYSSAGARMGSHKGKTASLRSAVLHGMWAFIRTYIVKRGVLDGRAGFLIALMNAEASFYKYAKLSLMSRSRD